MDSSYHVNNIANSGHLQTPRRPFHPPICTLSRRLSAVKVLNEGGDGGGGGAGGAIEAGELKNRTLRVRDKDGMESGYVLLSFAIFNVVYFFGVPTILV